MKHQFRCPHQPRHHLLSFYVLGFGVLETGWEAFLCFLSRSELGQLLNSECVFPHLGHGQHLHGVIDVMTEIICMEGRLLSRVVTLLSLLVTLADCEAGTHDAVEEHQLPCYSSVPHVPFNLRDSFSPLEPYFPSL